MSETHPVYVSIVDALDADARRKMTNEALGHAAAAESALLRLVAYANGLRNKIGLGLLDDDALNAARRQLRDLRQCAEALGGNLP